jgi:O-antigen ligase
LAVVAGVGLVALRNNDFVQNTFFHTDETSVASSSSNSDHWSACYGALKQVVREPLGRGPGSAGPASFHNGDQPPRIAENYYLQIGQEYGWLGLGLFVALSILVARELYARRREPLALALFAAFIGLTIANLLLHAWADDTLAYMFWGFTGLALARSGKQKHAATT